MTTENILRDPRLTRLIKELVRKYGTTSAGGGGVTSIQAGDNISIDDSDPSSPIISSTGGGTELTAGSGIRIEDGVVKLGAGETDGLLVEPTFLMLPREGTEALSLLRFASGGVEVMSGKFVDEHGVVRVMDNAASMGLVHGGVSSIDILKSPVSQVVTMDVIDQLSSKGLTYADDYSTNGTLDPRWIPDWGAVTTAIAEAPSSPTSWDDITDKPAVIASGATQAAARTSIGLGTAATQASTAFATSAQGALADTAVQPATLTAHTSATNNPHSVTAAQVGLGNVNNTSDANKPVSTATQSALDDKADVTDLTDHTSDTANPHSVTKAQVGLSNVTNDAQIPLSQKGVSNGVAELDSTGKVLSSQLPSYVDAVEEHPSLGELPTTGTDGVIYITTDNNLTYRWTGSTYVEISPSIALGETSSTAYRGDRGKTAFDHTSLTNNPHGVTATQVGLGNVNNTSDLNKPISTATQTALNDKVDTTDLTSHTSNTSNPHSVTAAQVGAVPTARTITAGTGLTGGGDLTANRSIALNTASTASLSLADTSLQPGDNISELTNDAGYITSAPIPTLQQVTTAGATSSNAIGITGDTEESSLPKNSLKIFKHPTLPTAYIESRPDTNNGSILIRAGGSFANSVEIGLNVNGPWCNRPFSGIDAVTGSHYVTKQQIPTEVIAFLTSLPGYDSDANQKLINSFGSFEWQQEGSGGPP